MAEELEEHNNVKVIKPIVVRSENVAKELQKVAKNSDVPVSSLDFSVLEVQTFSKMGSKEGDGADWDELAIDELDQITDDTTLLNPFFELKQIYEIEIFTKVEESVLDTLDISIGANANMTKVFLTIKEGSEINYYDELEHDFFAMVRKRKLRANILVDIFDDVQKDAILAQIARIKVSEHVEYLKKEVLLVAEGLEPAATINDKLILHYEEKSDNEDESGRIDYSKRGYILSVEEDELLIEYIKPREGKPGRDCRGKYIQPLPPETANEPTFTVMASIGLKEDDDKISYYAKKNGYISFENNEYDIATDVQVDEISFKTTGSIDTALNADVSINVKEADILKDAIGMGMDVKVHDIHVDGNMGPNSKVTAEEAKIEGQTHGSSIVTATELKINIHKGSAFGKNIEITRLEHGNVEGDVVKISQATGGVVKAREIYVELLGSHTKLYATEKIVVETLRGSENIFTIDPVLLGSAASKLDENEEKIIESERYLRERREEIKKYETLIEGNKKAYNDVKSRLSNYKKKGIKMPDAFVKKFKQFQKLEVHLSELRGAYQLKESRHKTLNAKASAYQSEITDARVIMKDRWRGHNEIKFMILDPKMELSFVPKENTKAEFIGVMEDEDGDFDIKVLES